jgi:hypothetical protein
MFKADNKQMHVWASIIQGIEVLQRMDRNNESVIDMKNKRAWQDQKLTERIQMMGISGWAVERDEQEMFGMGSQQFILKHHRKYIISGDFSMQKAREMFRNDIRVTIAEVHASCEPSRVA